jgi:uncharacterized membrane protein
MMIAQSISPGIDAILISLGGLMTALVLKLRLNRDGNPIRVRAVIGLVALAAATCLTKPVMVLFPALFWMIPTRRLPGRHPRIGKAIMIALPVLAGATWSLAMSAWIGPIGASDAHNASAQLDHIVHHPLTLITAFVRTWYTDMGGIVVRSFAGIFGYLDTSLPLWLDVVVYLAIGAYLWTYRRPVVNLARGERIFLAVAAFAFFYLNSLALYLVWTVPGTRYMDGLQGRYLLPALFLLLPVAPAAARLSRRGAAIVFRGLPVALLAISLLYIVERYYVSPLGELAQVL